MQFLVVGKVCTKQWCMIDQGESMPYCMTTYSLHLVWSWIYVVINCRLSSTGQRMNIKLELHAYSMLPKHPSGDNYCMISLHNVSP